MLTVEKLCFSYGQTAVLQDISFSLPAGECAALLGTNGAGKSTLLRCICRLLTPQSGTVCLDGTDMLRMTPPERARRIAYVPQEVQLPAGTVFDAVLSGRIPHFSRRAGEEDLAAVEEWLRALSLTHLALRDTRALSGGERQTVALARALTQSPAVLLLDEVTSSLDLRRQVDTVAHIRALIRTRPISVLMTAHDINLALRAADRLFLLDGGRIAADGGSEILTTAQLRRIYGVDMLRVETEYGTVLIPHP